MSKIGDAVIAAQERTGKEVEELSPEDLLDQELQDLRLGYVITDLRNGAAYLNTVRDDLSPVKEDIELVIAQLTKLSERIK